MCCSQEQHSINLSTDISIRQALDDEPIIYSKGFDSSLLIGGRMKVNMRPYSNVLHLNKRDSFEWPCVVEFVPPEIDSRQGIDAVFVIELSGNITALWLNSIKKCVYYSLTTLNKYDRVSIVVFNDTALKLCPLTVVSKSNLPKIYGCIKNLEGNGNGNVVEGITVGLSILSHRRTCNTISAMLIFAKPDILMEKDKGIFQEPENSTNIYVYSFGLGEHSSEYLNILASETNGSYFNVPHPLALPLAFGTCFGELLSLYAENLQTTIELLPSSIPMTLEKIYICQPHLIHGKTSEVCAVLNILPCSQILLHGSACKILKVLISYKLLCSGETVNEEYLLEVPVYSYENAKKSICFDSNVLMQVCRLKIADLLYEILFEESQVASELLGRFYASADWDQNELWVLQMREEVKNYENLLKFGWNPALKARIIYSVQGYFNKSLFYLPEFQTAFQLQQQKACKDIGELIRNNVIKPAM